MKSMKNIKPTYAVQLGKGVFMGGFLGGLLGSIASYSGQCVYKCRYCGKIFEMTNGAPNPDQGGRCPASNTGRHSWARFES